MPQRIVLLLVTTLFVGGCSDHPDEKSGGQKNPGDTSASNAKIPADSDKIIQMLGEKFGRDARAVRVDVVSDESGVRVQLRGEVPDEKIKQAIEQEVTQRVVGLRFQDFNLVVSGPVPLIGLIQVVMDDPGAIFTHDLHYAAVFERYSSNYGGPGTQVTSEHAPSIFDLWAGQRINRLNTVGLSQIKSMAFSPDGKWLATGHQHGQILLWEMPACQKRSVFEKARDTTQTNDVAALVFSPDSKMLASIQQAKGEVWLWNMEGSREARLIGTHDPNLNYLLSFSPDGKTLASCDDREQDVRLWDISSRTLKKKLESGGIHLEAIAWSPDNKKIAAGRTTEGQGLFLWDVESGKADKLNPSKNGLIHDVAFSPDGRILASRHEDAGVILWDLSNNKEWVVLDNRKVGSGRGMAFSPNGLVLAIGCEQMEPWTVGPPGFQFWDLSKRPGAGKSEANFPPQKTAPPEVRDDLLVAAIANRIRSAEGPQRVREIQAALMPDGSIRLTGKVTSTDVKENAARIASHDFAIEGKNGRTPRKVIDDMEVVGESP